MTGIITLARKSNGTITELASPRPIRTIAGKQVARVRHAWREIVRLPDGRLAANMGAKLPDAPERVRAAAPAPKDAPKEPRERTPAQREATVRMLEGRLAAARAAGEDTASIEKALEVARAHAAGLMPAASPEVETALTAIEAVLASTPGVAELLKQRLKKR